MTNWLITQVKGAWVALRDTTVTALATWLLGSAVILTALWAAWVWAVSIFWIVAGWIGTYFVLTALLFFGLGYGLARLLDGIKSRSADPLKTLGITSDRLDGWLGRIMDDRKPDIPFEFNSEMDLLFKALEKQGIPRVRTDKLSRVPELRVWKMFLNAVTPYLRAGDREGAAEQATTAQKIADELR
jgi:hypothetical protein